MTSDQAMQWREFQPDSHDIFGMVNCKGLVHLSQMIESMASIKKKQKTVSCIVIITNGSGKGAIKVMEC